MFVLNFEFEKDCLVFKFDLDWGYKIEDYYLVKSDLLGFLVDFRVSFFGFYWELWKNLLKMKEMVMIDNCKKLLYFFFVWFKRIYSICNY